MTEVRLVVNGQEYSGWEQVRFARSMEALSASFALQVTYDQPFPIDGGEPVELYFNDTKVLDGYVSTIEDSVTKKESQIKITGRDKTADLIDSSALHESQEFRNVGFTELLNILANPFGIEVDVQVSGLEAFEKFSLQQETAFEAIDRAARLRGVFVNSDAEGRIIVQDYGISRSSGALVMGDNVLSYIRSDDFTNRFSEYIVRGQRQGNDTDFGTNASAPEGRANDLQVKRYRPLVVLGEGNINSNQAKSRAQWEATVRAARSNEFLVKTVGWDVFEGGDLWEVNTLVSLQISERSINQDMLIREALFSLGAGGFITDLKLTRPDAYQKQPNLPEESFTEDEL